MPLPCAPPAPTATHLYSYWQDFVNLKAHTYVYSCECLQAVVYVFESVNIRVVRSFFYPGSACSYMTNHALMFQIANKIFVKYRRLKAIISLGLAC